MPNMPVLKNFFQKYLWKRKTRVYLPTQNNNNMNAQELKKGSIVKMTFTTTANEIQSNWEIRHSYTNGDSQTIMTSYVAECIVHRVTAKFFTVIIPHSKSESVRFSKECFTTTKMSYADDGNFKPSIVKI